MVDLTGDDAPASLSCDVRVQRALVSTHADVDDLGDTWVGLEECPQGLLVGVPSVVAADDYPPPLDGRVAHGHHFS